MQKLFDKFLHYLMAERYLSEHTVQAYKRDINQFLAFLETKTSVKTFHKLKPQHIKDFLKYLKRSLKINPKSASRKLSALKALSQYLFKNHRVPLFTKGISFPKLPKQLPKHLSEEQVHNILKVAAEDTSVTGQRNKIMIALLYTCGLRVSELLSLQTHNINFEEHCLHVLGKGGKERVVPIPQEILPLLKYYIEQVQPALIKNSDKMMTDHLFPVLYAGKVRAMTRQGLFHIIRNIAHQAGLVHSISPHVLRHSLATHLLKKGANLRILQMLLGHEKLTTVQVYTHLDVSHLQKLYKTFHPRAKK